MEGKGKLNPTLGMIQHTLSARFKLHYIRNI